MTAEIVNFGSILKERQSKALELKRILHVDDDDDIRSVVKMTLEVFGDYELLQCASGEEAIATSQEFKPQLILLDVMMPEMCGVQTWRELEVLEGLEHVPVVFLTVKADGVEREALLEDEAPAIIDKPFDPNDLCNEIQHVWADYLAASRAQNEQAPTQQV